MLHPIAVNLTIFSISAFLILEILFIVTKKSKFSDAGNIILYFAIICTCVAVLSGLRAFSTIDFPIEALDEIKMHRTFGITTFFILLFLTLLRLTIIKPQYQKSLLKKMYYLVLIIIGIMLFQTGSLGGNMAYKYDLRNQTPAETPIQKPSFEE